MVRGGRVGDWVEVGEKVWKRIGTGLDVVEDDELVIMDETVVDDVIVLSPALGSSSWPSSSPPSSSLPSSGS